MATLGTGIIILIVLWCVALLSLVVLCSSQGKLKNLGIVPSIIVAIVTIVLVSIPTSNDSTAEPLPAYNYSYTSLSWILTLTGLCVTLVGCLFAYLFTEIMEPRYAKVSKTFKIR
jgi:hypothetical protein